MKTLNDYFDKIYCINLEKRTDRWENCLKEFEKNSILVEKYVAIDGEQLNSDNKNLFETPGQLGCLLSHLDIIKKSKEMNLSSVLILEDDVEFCEDFNNILDQKIKDLPNDWNMLFFGANHIVSPTKITDNIFKINKCYSAHCYAIREIIYDHLINLLSKLKEPLDVTYSNIQYEYNSYIFNPHLVWQKPGYSNICKQEVDYTHVHKIILQ